MVRRQAWIGLGGNLGDVQQTLSSAQKSIRELSATDLLVSPIYESEPWGIAEQPVFLNQVVGITPVLSPIETLTALLEIERNHGRIRGQKWGPRTLDLDLLSWPEITMDTAELILPHPRMAERGFVLAPWADIAPGLIPFGLSLSVKAMLEQFKQLDGSGWVQRCSSSAPTSA
jgi:2-amino-4-hydroxy-6-hydroxymethyldihydropteridine diphosphokinase